MLIIVITVVDFLGGASEIQLIFTSKCLDVLYHVKPLTRVSTVFRDLQKELTGCRYIQMDEL